MRSIAHAVIQHSGPTMSSSGHAHSQHAVSSSSALAAGSRCSAHHLLRVPQVRLTLLEMMVAQKDSMDRGLSEVLPPAKVSLEFSTKPRSLRVGPGDSALPPLPGRVRTSMSAPRMPRIEDSAEEGRTSLQDGAAPGSGAGA